MKADIDEFKGEVEGRFTALDEKLETISKNGEKLERILTEIAAIKEKYTSMTSKTSNFEELEKDLDGMKEDVNNILEVLKATFPPIIKTLKELKGPARRRNEVEHLL